MSIDQNLGLFFKSDIRANGSQLFAQNRASLANASETFVQAYVKDGSSYQVRLLSTDIASPSFSAECNCATGKKNRFCKHIWAALLCVEQKNPDFLNAKVSIDKPEIILDPKKEAAKKHASEYRKAQYRKQKEYLKEIKKNRETRFYSADVQVALDYFLKNGFDFDGQPSEEAIAKAKRALSKVFHPDRGGSDGEAAELNRMCEVLFNSI